MHRFLKLPRYPFTRAMLESAPSEPGVFGLFDGDELIYIGKALGGPQFSLWACLVSHQNGEHGTCTIKATTYTWEIALQPSVREKALLVAFRNSWGTQPRCQANSPR